jgi:hypothetical protein
VEVETVEQAQAPAAAPVESAAAAQPAETQAQGHADPPESGHRQRHTLRACPPAQDIPMQ